MSDSQQVLGGVGAFVVTEQALWAYDNDHPAVPYVPLCTPRGNAHPGADHPAVLSLAPRAATKGPRTEANEVLGARAFTPDDGVKALAASGFRGPDQAAARRAPRRPCGTRRPLRRVACRRPVAGRQAGAGVGGLQADAVPRADPRRRLGFDERAGQGQGRQDQGGHHARVQRGDHAAPGQDDRGRRPAVRGVPHAEGPVGREGAGGPLEEKLGPLTRKDQTTQTLSNLTAQNGAGTPLYRSLLDGIAEPPRSPTTRTRSTRSSC
ncbi:hypothetical protein ACU686_44660 [Yinghuangia aomiensis]